MATLLRQRSTLWLWDDDARFDQRAWWNIYYEQSASDKALNRTKIIVEYVCEIQYNGSHNNFTILPFTLSCKINGNDLGTLNYPEKSSYIPPIGTSWHTIGTKTTYVYHNNDGTANVTFQGFSTYDMSYVGEISNYKLNTTVSTNSLPRIPRGARATTTTTESSRLDFDTNTTITINRDVSSYLIDLYYEVGGNRYDILTNSSETSVTYKFPLSLINSFPTTGNPNITLKCRAVDTNVTSDTIVYLHVPNSYKPSVSVSINDTNTICKNWGIYVKTKSVLEVTINASGTGGASISSYASSIGNYNSTSSQFTTSPLSNGTEVESMTLTCNVNDSRTRTTNYTNNLVVYNYTQPTISNVELLRCNSDGTLNNSGTYCKVKFNYNISPCNNKNSKSASITCGSTTKQASLSNYSGTYTSPTSDLFSGMNIDRSYSFSITLNDSFGSNSITSVLPNSYITRSYKAGGKGISFGELSTNDGFSCNMNANFKQQLKKNNVDVATVNDLGSIVEIGSNINGNWIKYDNGYMECTKVVNFSGKAVTSGYFAGTYGVRVSIGATSQTFTEVWDVSCSGKCSNTTYWHFGCLTSNSNSSFGNAELCRPNSSGNISGTLYCKMTGKWK